MRLHACAQTCVSWQALVQETRRTCIYVHAKTMMVDDEVCLLDAPRVPWGRCRKAIGALCVLVSVHMFSCSVVAARPFCARQSEDPMCDTAGFNSFWVFIMCGFWSKAVKPCIRHMGALMC